VGNKKKKKQISQTAALALALAARRGSKDSVEDG